MTAAMTTQQMILKWATNRTPQMWHVRLGTPGITPNETETRALTGIEPSDETAAARAGEVLRARGVDRVAMKLGPAGCVYVGPEGTIAVPAPKVDAIDTVAAGDAFNGALAASLVEGHDVEGSLRRACSAGAIAATRRGALPSLPTRAEVEAALKGS